MNGYIKLHRKIFKNEIAKNPQHFLIWVWLLTRASYTARTVYPTIKGMRIPIGLNVGDLVVIKSTTSEFIGVSPSMLWRVLLKLEKMGMIIKRSTTHYTVVSICNYETYQNSEPQKTPIINEDTGWYEDEFSKADRELPF